MMRLFVAAMLSASLWRGFAIDSSDDNRPSRLMRKQGIDTPAVQLTSDGDVQHGSSHQESAKNASPPGKRRPAAAAVIKSKIKNHIKSKIKNLVCTNVPIDFHLEADEVDCSLAFRIGRNEKPMGRKPGHIKCNTALELAVKDLKDCQEMVTLHNAEPKAGSKLKENVRELHPGRDDEWDQLPEGCSIKGNQAYFKNGGEEWYGNDETPKIAEYRGEKQFLQGVTPVCTRPRYTMGRLIGKEGKTPVCGCGYQFVQDAMQCSSFTNCGVANFNAGWTAGHIDENGLKGCFFQHETSRKHRPLCKIEHAFLR
jgi:hypothetical protein